MTCGAAFARLLPFSSAGRLSLQYGIWVKRWQVLHQLHQLHQLLLVRLTLGMLLTM